MSLYQFTNFSTPQARYDGAPRLVPVGRNTGYLSSNSLGYQLIDVINNFQWTTTPKTGRQEVPAIYLKEKRLKTNSLVSQALYYSFSLGANLAAADAKISQLPQEVQAIIKGALGAYAGDVIGSGIGGLLGVGANLAGTGSSADFLQRFANAAGPLGTAIGGVLGVTGVVDPIKLGYNFIAGLANLNLGSNLNIDSLGSDTLKPYEGLYITEDTKFVYNLPYFSNVQNVINNAFADSDEAFAGGNSPLMGKEFIEGMRSIATAMAVVVNLTAPGIYIERPKFYEYSNKGEQITFSFPLINTGWATYQDVLNNWQLLFLLTYQNRPNRRSRELIDPAVIYDLTIPGVRYFPFAYIENMKVEFKGARRRMELTVPYQSGQTTINTIVPDAYIVTIQLRTLVNETQNFLYSMLSDKQNIITVTDTNRPGDIIIREIFGNIRTQAEIDRVNREGLPANGNFNANTGLRRSITPQ